MQRGFVALAMPVRTFSITKILQAINLALVNTFFIFVFTETEKVTQTGTGSEDLPVTVASSKQGISFLTRGYAKRRNGFLLGLRHANVSLAHSGVEFS